MLRKTTVLEVCPTELFHHSNRSHVLVRGQCAGTSTYRAVGRAVASCAEDASRIVGRTRNEEDLLARIDVGRGTQTGRQPWRCPSLQWRPTYLGSCRSMRRGRTVNGVGVAGEKRRLQGNGCPTAARQEHHRSESLLPSANLRVLSLPFPNITRSSVADSHSSCCCRCYMAAMSNTSAGQQIREIATG
jgi:hypothetical protein